MNRKLPGSFRIPVLVVALGAVALPSISYAQAAPAPSPAPAPAAAPERPRGRQNRALGSAQARPQAQRAQQLQQVLEQLDLSAEQKGKIQPILQDSRQKLQQIMQSTTDPQQRRQQIQEAMKDIRKQVNDVLTPEQRTKLQELIKERRAAATTQPAGTARAARAGQGGIIARLEEAALGLNLTEEQQTQVKDLTKEYQDEVAAILKDNAGGGANGRQAGAGRNGVGQQLRTVLQEYRSRLTQLLTPEQSEQFNKKLTEMRLQQWNAGGGAGKAGGAGQRLGTRRGGAGGAQ